MAGSPIVPQVEGEFLGVYVVKNLGEASTEAVGREEIGEILVDSEKKFLGIFPSKVRLTPEFPAGFSLPPPPHQGPGTELVRFKPRFFQIKFRGIPGEPYKVQIGATGRRRIRQDIKITTVFEMTEVSGL